MVNTLLTLCLALGLCVNFATSYRFSPPIASVKARARRCKINEFDCSSKCISEDLVCDGKKDCDNSRDESACYYFPCPAYAFKCTYGACISPDLVCDGVQHCKDNSDENPYRCNVKSIESIHQNCSRLQFMCQSGECIEDFNLCDGKVDCSDGTDETVEVCTLLRCPEYGFRCDYGACINGDLRCDGTQHCIDGSDEKHCDVNQHTPTLSPKPTCSWMQYQCASGQCINDFYLCDGEPNCRDGSDENCKTCSLLHCPLYAFQCDYGACINADLRCNGMKDCYDASDERNCTRPTHTVQPAREDSYDVRIYFSDTTERTPPLPPVLPTDAHNMDTQSTAQHTNATCVLPSKIPDGWPIVKANRIVSNSSGVVVVKKFTKMRFGCRAGYALHPTNANAVCNNQWNPPDMPSCLRTCSSIATTYYLRATCSLENRNVSCEHPKQGTVAILTCAIDPTVSQYRTCFDGSWDYPLLTCPPRGKFTPLAV